MMGGRLTQKPVRSLGKAKGVDAQVRALEKRLNLDCNQEGDRFKARGEIAALLEPWLAARTIDDVSVTLELHGVCWGPYQTVRQMVSKDPACSPANPMFSLIEQPGVGQLLSAASVYDFNGSTRAPAAPAPVLGEHTEEVLAEVLGIGQAEFGRLLEGRIVTTCHLSGSG